MADEPDPTPIEALVGHPREKWEALQARVTTDRIRTFGEVEDAWLDLMWTLDQYRIAGVPPRGMGKMSNAPRARLDAVYRGKGNWFATLLARLLEHQTTHRLAPRQRVQGFSQFHQVDIAWPDREVDPLLCLETKVTGAPGHGATPARRAMGDWSNRRKELKFAATDLKLFRRQHLTAITHWDVWRSSVYPKTFFLWAARVTPFDSIDRMVHEVQALVKTYLEGAGIVAWRDVGDRYETVAIPPVERVSTVDDVLFRIASEITLIAPPGAPAPPPQEPSERAIDIELLGSDEALP